MEAAIDRIMQTYALLVNSSSAVGIEEARAKVTEYIGKLFQAGEKDPHRLTVCGLTYLRELDGSTDMLAKARTQRLRGACPPACRRQGPGGSIRATHGKHNGRSLVPVQAGRRQRTFAARPATNNRHRRERRRVPRRSHDAD